MNSIREIDQKLVGMWVSDQDGFCVELHEYKKDSIAEILYYFYSTTNEKEIRIHKIDDTLTDFSSCWTKLDNMPNLIGWDSVPFYDLILGKEGYYE